MNELTEIKVTGQQEFMGIEIPVVEGGFGENCKAILAKTIAEIHNVATKHINELINKNIIRFKTGIDIIDLVVVLTAPELKELGFTQQALNSYKGMRLKGNGGNIYLLSERGYAKLSLIFDGKEDISSFLIRDYFGNSELNYSKYVDGNNERKEILLLES